MVMEKTPFSQLLQRWHKGSGPKTLDGLSKVFAEKAFAIIILILLAPSALPLPTGGVTNVLEVIAMLLALELVIGRKTIWLPKKWRHLNISGSRSKDKLVPFVAKRIRWFERFSKPRLQGLINDPRFLPVIGLVIFVLTLASFLAPPFSGLDTLPSMGVVLICLSLILDDAALLGLGLIIGGLGVGLEVGVGKALIYVVKNWILKIF